jgi:hypothetical protein
MTITKVPEVLLEYRSHARGIVPKILRYHMPTPLMQMQPYSKNVKRFV